MAIMLQGTRLKNVRLGFGDDGVMNMGGDYELMSSTGVVLAKNSFNGYSDIKVALTPALSGQLSSFLTSLKEEVNKTLGLE